MTRGRYFRESLLVWAWVSPCGGGGGTGPVAMLADGRGAGADGVENTNIKRALPAMVGAGGRAVTHGVFPPVVGVWSFGEHFHVQVAFGVLPRMMSLDVRI